MINKLICITARLLNESNILMQLCLSKEEISQQVARQKINQYEFPEDMDSSNYWNCCRHYFNDDCVLLQHQSHDEKKVSSFI